MGNDLMTANTVPNPVFSDITMAFFEDTGWYEIDYDYAENFIFAKNEGCDFLYESCYDNRGNPAFP